MLGKRLPASLAALCLMAGLAAAAEEQRPDRRPPGPRRAERGEARGGVEGTRPADGRSERPGWLEPAQEEELLEALKSHRPERYDQLLRLRREAPRLYRVTLGRLWRWYQTWREMSDKAREAAFQLEEARMRIFHLLREVRRAAPGPPRREAVRRLRLALDQQFEAEQALREERLAQLEEELKRIREELKKRAERRSEIIEERLGNLMTSPPPDADFEADSEPADAEKPAESERDAE